MKKSLYLFLLLLLVLLVPLSLAETNLAEVVTNFGQQVQGQEIPSPLDSLFGNERVNGYITLKDGEELVVGFVTEDGKVKNFMVAEVKDPTLNIYSGEETFVEVMNSNNPFQAVQNAMDNGGITYQAVGFKNKVKFWFASVATSITGLFNSKSSNSDAGVSDVGVFEKKNNDDVLVQENVLNQEKESVNANELEDVKEDINEVQEDNELNEKKTEDKENVATDIGNELTGEVVKEIQTAATHIIKLIDGGKAFSAKEINIKVGETIEWLNIRSGRFTQGLIIGTQKCRDVRSKIYDTGDSYSYTFEKPGTCVIVDGIYTTVTMKVIVSE